MKTELSVSSPSSLSLGPHRRLSKSREIDTIASSQSQQLFGCQLDFLVVPDGLEPSLRAYETQVRTVRCHQNLIKKPPRSSSGGSLTRFPRIPYIEPPHTPKYSPRCCGFIMVCLLLQRLVIASLKLLAQYIGVCTHGQQKNLVGVLGFEPSRER